MRILLVSDKSAANELLCEQLQQEGHEITLSESASVTWRTIRGDFDLLVYDLGEAAPSAWHAFAHWRQLTDLPILVIGPSVQEKCVVRALHMGADDYVARPLPMAELIARCEALHRRAKMAGWSELSEAESQSELAFSWRPHQIKIGERYIDLTPIEFKLLEVLWQHRGQPVSRDELARLVWGKDQKAVNTNLGLYIWHLRQKIEEDPRHPKLILTRRRLGYCLQGTDDAEDQIKVP